MLTILKSPKGFLTACVRIKMEISGSRYGAAGEWFAMIQKQGKESLK